MSRGQLAARFRLRADAVLHFISDPALPFTNNFGKRAVYMPKVKQKILGCILTLAEAHYFYVIRSSLDTLPKQGHGMPVVLQRAFAGDPTALSAQRPISHGKLNTGNKNFYPF